jgi:hypothetical protein
MKFILTLILVAGIFLGLDFFLYLLNKNQLLKIQKFASFIAETINGRIKWPTWFRRKPISVIGEYKGYVIEVYPERYSTQILIFSDKLPKQKKFMISYPKVASSIHQIGNYLTMTVYDKEFRDSVNKERLFIQNIDTLLAAVIQMESNSV